MQDSNIFNSFTQVLDNPNNLMLLVLIVCVILFLTEGYKYLKYKTRSDVMDLSLLAAIFISTFI